MACYLIRAGETARVKIGFAMTVKSRVAELQAAHWETFHVVRTWVGTRGTEAWIQRQFNHLRIARDWFVFDPGMMVIQPPPSATDQIIVQDLIDKAGGETQFQVICGVARTTVLDWKRTGFIPASRVARISASLDVPLEEVIKLVAEPRDRSVQPQSGEAA